MDDVSDTADRIDWSWKRAPVFSSAMVGDPSTVTSFDMCVYDGVAGVPTLVTTLTLPPSLAWHATANDWRYDDSTGAVDGIRELRLASGAPKKSAVRLLARGVAVPMPAGAGVSFLLHVQPVLRVQLIASTAEGPTGCWESTFPSDSVRRNDPIRFKAVSTAVAPPKRAFVSSECYDGGLGGLGGADATCQSLADAAALGGSFKAWLATAGEGPATRFVHGDAPYVLLDGTVVAADWTDLADGTLSAPIALDETLSPPDAESGCGSDVWTNVSIDGSSAIGDGYEFVCQDWTAPLYARSGLTGSAAAVDARWTDGGAFGMQPCSELARLYCFEQ